MEELESRSDRARIHDSTRDVYEALTGGNDPEQTPFFSLKDVFMVACSIGYKKGKSMRKPLETGKKEGIRMEVFTEKERDVLKGIALAETGDIKVLEKKPDELISGKVLTIAEEYANGGIEELRSMVIEKPGYALLNLVALIKQDQNE